MKEQYNMENFHILDTIGYGSYGKVVKVRNKKTNKLYALKNINVLAKGQKERHNILVELHILAYCKCPFILKLHHCIYQNYIVGIITSYLEKGDLNRVIKTYNDDGCYLPESLIWSYFIQICYALEYLHKNNIIHRDIKTRNILVSHNNYIKVGDFGVSKILKKGKLASTVIGTPVYMSPEIINSNLYDHKIDIWSLGCVLYEMIMLKPPFNSKSIYHLMKNINSVSYPKIINKCNYSSSLLDLVSKLLKLNPKERLSVKNILALNSISSRIHLAPAYNRNSHYHDIPVIPNYINNWHRIVELYNKKYPIRYEHRKLEPYRPIKHEPKKVEPYRPINKRSKLYNKNKKDILLLKIGSKHESKYQQVFNNYQVLPNI